MNNLEFVRQELLNQYQTSLGSRKSVSIEVTVTSGCNKNCSYCFEAKKVCNKSKKIEARQIELIVDYCRRFDIAKFGELDINFWGGEPMLNMEFILDIIEATKQFKFVHYFMYTNGTLTDKFKTLISDFRFIEVKPRFAFQISYDGSPHHEEKRGYGTTDIFNTADLFSTNHIQFSFKATLTYDSVKYLPEIWDSYHELYNRYGECATYSPSLDSTAKNITASQLEDWKTALIKVARKEFKFFKIHKHPLWGWLTGDGTIHCARDYTVHLHDDGNTYICHGCPYSSHCNSLAMKTIFDVKSLDELIVDHGISSSKIVGKCSVCSTIYCAKCHIALIKDFKHYSDWRSCRPSSSEMCQFYAWFSLIARLINWNLVNSIGTGIIPPSK